MSQHLEALRLSAALELFQKSRKRIAFQFTGGSMAPYLCNGDEVIIECIDTPLRIGDVILLRRLGGWKEDGREVKDKWIVHRVVGTYCKDKDSFFIVKGDANDATDPPLLRHQILGRLVESRTTIWGKGITLLPNERFGVAIATLSYWHFILAEHHRELQEEQKQNSWRRKGLAFFFRLATYLSRLMIGVISHLFRSIEAIRYKMKQTDPENSETKNG